MSFFFFPVTEPLKLVGMDSVGKLTLTDSGNQYMCVIRAVAGGCKALWELNVQGPAH